MIAGLGSKAFQTMDPGGRLTMTGVFWWVRQIFLCLAGCFFLLFGIHLLIAAYGLQDPFSFVMTFFASNLIILISAALLAGFVIKMVQTVRASHDQDA